MKILIDKATVELALEALEGVLDDAPKVLDASIAGGLYEVVQCRDAITAIKQALAQPVQGPVAARPCRSCDGTGERYTGIDEAPTSICKPCAGTGQIALAQPERPWVGLTEEDLKPLSDK